MSKIKVTFETNATPDDVINMLDSAYLVGVLSLEINDKSVKADKAAPR